MIYLGILIGFILGLPIGFIKWNKKTIPAEKYSRRGLLSKEFSVTDGITGNITTVGCNFEVGELESTDKLSKIEVIFVKSNKSEYNSDYNKKRLTDMIDKSWVNSKDIIWITTAADKRNQKIDQVLS